MSKYLPLGLLFLFFQNAPLKAQVSYTANDTIAEFKGQFRYGSNVGAYYYWRDEQLADIAAGNPELGVEGIGVDAFRPLLSESFLHFWGYDIRIDAFKHYAKLGMKDNVVFVGYPAEEHRDLTNYCPDGPSELFANMYEPIWDDGENGTPVNDENYYALYMWEMVRRYHEYVRYWEIWNEPDFVGGSNRQPVRRAIGGNTILTLATMALFPSSIMYAYCASVMKSSNPLRPMIMLPLAESASPVFWI
ncbi:MAG: hypothetical protein R2788_22430 [Saprospiraceae bacterium]